jgi:hypothetical protein
MAFISNLTLPPWIPESETSRGGHIHRVGGDEFLVAFESYRGEDGSSA